MAEASLPKPPPRTQSQPTRASGDQQHCGDHRRNCPFQDRPKLRWAFLVSLAVLVVAVLIVGVVFTVYYDALYYSSGAFLLREKQGAAEATPESAVAARDVGVCGRDRDSCQAYGQPNICCPAGMTCFSSAFSPSGVYCCAAGSACLVTADQPPACDNRTSTCGRLLGGGCCTHGTQCSADGCLEVYLAAPGFASSVLSGTQTPTPTSAATTTAGGVHGTHTQGVTVTTTKVAEIALSQGLKGVQSGFGFSSCPSLEVLVLGFAFALLLSYAMLLRGG
ncbi:hypothetical protein F4804DRAFT_334422 [Jackrogersella minutella]|nr:hypothetical protein F4804DRAFT_334422 [Jackrogersella minutella]